MSNGAEEAAAAIQTSCRRSTGAKKEGTVDLEIRGELVRREQGRGTNQLAQESLLKKINILKIIHLVKDKISPLCLLLKNKTN